MEVDPSRYSSTRVNGKNGRSSSTREGYSNTPDGLDRRPRVARRKKKNVVQDRTVKRKRAID